MARWLRLLGVSLLVGVIGGVGVVVTEPDTPWPAVVAAGGLAIASMAVQLLQEKFKQNDSQQQAVLRAHARQWHRWSGLPRVRRISPPTLLRRRGSSAMPAYIPRDQDEELRSALARGGLIIVQGPSAAGKTRAAYEALLHHATRRTRLLLPVSPGSLVKLREAGVRLRDTIIWLDDLERYVIQGKLEFGQLEGLGATVLATLRTTERARLAEGHADTADELLGHATVIELRRALSQDELARARQSTDPQIVDVLSRATDSVELGAHLIAGPAILERWRMGQEGSPHDRAGAALVSAAIDVHRCGLLRPLPAELLGRLYPHYLADRDEPVDVNTALAWATAPVRELSGCLERAGSGAYLPADYLVDRVQEMKDGPQVPEGVWTDLAAWAPTDLRGLAAGAQRAGQIAVAERLLRSGGGDPAAVFDLALLLHEQGRLQEARRHYEEAAERGVVAAHNNLGLLLSGAEAQAHLSKAMAAGVVEAANNLGLLTDDEQLFAEAHHAGSQRAGNNLGVLALIREDPLAQALLREAAFEGVPEAGANLGLLLLADNLRKKEALTEAEGWLRQAVAAGLPESQNNLAVLLEQRGDHGDADTLYLRAAEAGVATACWNYANSLDRRSRNAEAREWRARSTTTEPGDHGVALLAGSILDADLRLVNLRHSRGLTVKLATRKYAVPLSSRLSPAHAGWQIHGSGLYEQLRPSREPAALVPRTRVPAADPSDRSGETRRRWMHAQRARGIDPASPIDRSDLDDFSFLVLGSPGSGGIGQYAVLPGMLALGYGSAFMVICGEVINPTTSVRAYLDKFFHPYRGYAAPIFAVPGASDWTDGLTAFMKVFCDAPPIGNLITETGVDEAALTRARAYRPTQPYQPGPYWTLDTSTLRLVGIDCGASGALDAEQAAWLTEVSRGDRPKLLLSSRSMYINNSYEPIPLPSGGTVDDIVRDPACRYIAVIGGGAHNYQRYPVRAGERIIQYIVAGGSGALLDPTHIIPRVDVAGVHEDDFRCYPLRGDSLAYFSALASPRWRLTPEEAVQVMSERLGSISARLINEPNSVTRRMRRTARALGAGAGALPTITRLRLSRAQQQERPPLFKSFLRLSVASQTLTIQCFAATGAREHEIAPPLEDEVHIWLGD